MRYILHARENGKRANYMFVTLYLTSNYLQNVWLLYLILNQDLFLNVFIVLRTRKMHIFSVNLQSILWK